MTLDFQNRLKERRGAGSVLGGFYINLFDPRCYIMLHYHYVTTVNGKNYLYLLINFIEKLKR